MIFSFRENNTVNIIHEYRNCRLHKLVMGRIEWKTKTAWKRPEEIAGEDFYRLQTIMNQIETISFKHDTTVVYFTIGCTF